MQIISQERILPWGLMVLRESDLNGYCPKKESLFTFWKRARFEGGREGNQSTGACPLYYLSFFLNFLSFLLYFLSYLFFFFFLLCFSFHSVKMLCFSMMFSGHGKGPFIVPAVTNLLPFCPLTASVWSGRTCRPPSLCDIHYCQTEAGLFCSPVYRNTSFLPWYKCFLSLLSRHASVPPQTCLFWVVYHLNRTYLPKGLGQEPQNRPFPLSPPPNHTPFTSSLWPMAPPCPILAGYRLVVLGPCACFPWCLGVARAFFSDMSKSLPVAHTSAVIWRLSVYVSQPFMWAFLLVSRSIQELGFVCWWALHFFGPFFIFFVACYIELLFLP